ncbi:MAG: tRNA lysidine(34) synthetase TilS [Ignavibacteriales bacterium]|nr:tRNA lysidine(34) synthetase TilS [Ignavibacteriales bacterium]
MRHHKTIEQSVINFIKDNDLLCDAKKILIGLSGGADSVFALHFFKKFLKKYKIEITAVHINHLLRGEESERDEKFCSELCKSWDIDFHSSKVNVKNFAKKNKNSIEEAARILRYKQFQKVANKNKCDLIVTAHNNDDNTETVLLNIVSGSGIRGLSGIPVKRENIIRPFICLSKMEMETYLINNNIKFVVDSSNKNLDINRNFLRKEIIPSLKKNLNPSLDKVILNSSFVLRDQIKLLDFFLNDIINRIVEISENKILISVEELKKYPKEILGELFLKIFQEKLTLDFSYDTFSKLEKLLKSQTGISIELGKSLIGIKERNSIILAPKENEETFEKEVFINDEIFIGNSIISIKSVKKIPDYSKNKNIEYISGDLINDRMLIRNWNKGDKIKLLGMKGTKRVSDVLTDLKVPVIERKKQLVLLNDKEIVWIIGKKISENYKITSNTKKKLKLCLS